MEAYVVWSSSPFRWCFCLDKDHLNISCRCLDSAHSIIGVEVKPVTVGGLEAFETL